MSAASDGFVPVRGRGGMLRLVATGWSYFAPQALLLRTPIGDPLRCFVLTEAEVQKYFGKEASFDGFEVEAP